MPAALKVRKNPDNAKLQELPPLPNPEPSCFMAIVNSLAVSTTVPTDLREQMDELLGYFENLRKRGCEILAPGI